MLLRYTVIDKSGAFVQTSRCPISQLPDFPIAQGRAALRHVDIHTLSRAEVESAGVVISITTRLVLPGRVLLGHFTRN